MPEIIEEKIIDECLSLDSLVKGKFIHNVKSFNEMDLKCVHYDVKNIRNLAEDIMKVYSKGGKREDFVKIIEKHKKIHEDEVHNFESKVENIMEEGVLKVVSRKKNKDGTVEIKFKKISNKEKSVLVKSIAKKLSKTVTRKQLEVLFEQSIMKLNDIDKLKKVDKKLKKKTKPKIKGVRSCYKLVVDDVDVFLVG